MPKESIKKRRGAIKPLQAFVSKCAHSKMTVLITKNESRLRRRSAALDRKMRGSGTDCDRKEAALAIGLARVLNAEGGTVDARKAAKLFGGPCQMSESAVSAAAKNGQLLGIRDMIGHMRFPVWQFGKRGGLLPGIPDVLEILFRQPFVDSVAAAVFFSIQLFGLMPCLRLRHCARVTRS